MQTNKDYGHTFGSKWRVVGIGIDAAFRCEVAFESDTGSALVVTFPSPPPRLAEYQSKMGQWFDDGDQPWMPKDAASTDRRIRDAVEAVRSAARKVEDLSVEASECREELDAASNARDASWDELAKARKKLDELIHATR